jgi:hypothetical protein
MKRWAKRAGWIVLAILVLLFLFNIYHKCSSVQGSNASDDRQLAIYKEYAQKTDAQNTEYMRKMELQLARAVEVTEKTNRNEERLEKLLQRWEKQADRYDALLNKWEKQSK